jgi:8-oxo-dGTP pyrophosphatase MutT (NUDIX family)
METALFDIPPSTASFLRFVQDRLHCQPQEAFAFNENGDLRKISAVLFLLGPGIDGKPVLILNKRSRHVRQPGDLCCPGGGVQPSLDPFLARWLRLPAPPLSRWSKGFGWRRYREKDWSKLALLLAAALREGFEEMRLNPLGVRFLGPMAAERLVMFHRTIYPLVGWVPRQRLFFPNWEVEKIVRIPLASLLDDAEYACCRISFQDTLNGGSEIPDRDMPCFVHRANGQRELLWGATYRLTERFLATVFGYRPPAVEALPVVPMRLDHRYLGIPMDG